MPWLSRIHRFFFLVGRLIICGVALPPSLVRWFWQMNQNRDTHLTWAHYILVQVFLARSEVATPLPYLSVFEP